MTTVIPVRREIRVMCSVERAFAVFTEQIGAWWPLAGYSVFGDGTVAFEGREVVERSGDRSSVWAEVTEWDPPHLFALSWHTGTTAELATEVRVRFTSDGGETLVELEHSGWERLADPGAAREYGRGWPNVLRQFADCAESAASAAGR